MDTYSIDSYISLFSGCGGLDLALRIASPTVKCRAYCEREGPAAAILAARMGEGVLDEAPIYTDVRTFPSELYRGRVAGIVGGTPCQDLSVAGKQAGIGGERSGLFHDFMRIVDEVGAEWIFWENVAGAVSTLTIHHRRDLLDHIDALQHAAETAETARDRWYISRHRDRLYGRLLGEYGIPALLYVCCRMEERGFRIEAGLFTASEVGAPHKRERVFIYAWRMDDAARDERHRLNGQSGSGRGVCETGDELADTGHERDQRHRGAGDVRGAEGAEQSEALEREWNGHTAGYEREIVADASLRGQRERGEPSGRGGFAHGRGEAMENTEYSEWWPHGSLRGIATNAGASSGHVANPGDGQLSQSRRGSEGRDGAGPAWRRLGNTGLQHGDLQQREVRTESTGTGDSVENAEHARSPRARATAASQAETDDARGSSELALANPSDGQLQEPWRGPKGRDGAGPASAVLGDAEDDHGRRGERGAEEGTGPGRERRRGSTESSIPLFPPGPGDFDAWRRIIAERPDLAPATQPEVRGVADGLASRLHQLRAIGNGVVSLAGAVAYRILKDRATSPP